MVDDRPVKYIYLSRIYIPCLHVKHMLNAAMPIRISVD